MCKRNSPDKNEASAGCVRETPQIEKKKKILKSQLGMCKKKEKKEKHSHHGMCKRNSPDKNEASTGCVRETPQIKMKPVRDV